MLVGVPKEIKNHEYRVGLTPAAVKEFVSSIASDQDRGARLLEQ